MDISEACQEGDHKQVNPFAPGVGGEFAAFLGCVSHTCLPIKNLSQQIQEFVDAFAY